MRRVSALHCRVTFDDGFVLTELQCRQASFSGQGGMAPCFFPEFLRSHTRQALEGFLQTDANLKRPGTVPDNRPECIVKQIAIDESRYVNVSIANSRVSFSLARITIFRPNRQDTHE